MRHIVIVSSLFLFALASLNAQEDFSSLAWKKFTSTKLYYDIYLTAKFKKKPSNDQDYEIYIRRKTPAIGVGVLRYSESLGQLSKAEAENFIHDLYIELYLYSTTDYYKTWEPTPIANRAGQNGFQFCLHEWVGLTTYQTLYECFFDCDGYIYVVLTVVNSKNLSPVVGTGVTFVMQNGCLSSLIKPFANEPAEARPSARAAAQRITKFKNEAIELYEKHCKKQQH